MTDSRRSALLFIMGGRADLAPFLFLVHSHAMGERIISVLLKRALFGAELSRFIEKSGGMTGALISLEREAVKLF